jgi:two-component system, LytTR family, sensor histidine kinase AlgZ
MAFGLLLASVLAVSQQTPWLWSIEFAVPETLVLGVLALSTWFLVRALPAAETPLLRIVGTWLGAVILILAAWLWLCVMWGRWLSDLSAEPSLREVPSRLAALLLLVGAVGLLVAIVGHYLIAASDRSRRAETRALELQVLARDAELKSLRSQLDPHFLFNSLNSVAALIGTSDTDARRMCILLATFCRKSISLGRESSIRLEQELELVDTFLSIETVRFRERLSTQVDVAKDTLDVAVPPLMLQPLVENAIHHGIAHLIDGGQVLITARRRDQLLELSVENPFDTDAPPSRGAGVGINNVRSRIHTLYGNKASVEIDNSNQRFRVTILMPANLLPKPTQATMRTT